MIVLQPDGTEITRIASATMASELPELLRVAAGRTTSIEALLAKAEDDTASLTADDWKILAGFDWRNDPKHFAGPCQSGHAARPAGGIRARAGAAAALRAARAGRLGRRRTTTARSR